MSGYIKIPQRKSTLSRNYSQLRGVDFATEASKVDTRRSPDAVNVYKDYTSEDAGAIQSRPGFRSVGNAGGYVWGIHCVGNEILVHSGKNLRKTVGFAGGIERFIDICDEMNESKSVSFIFGGKLYILDGRTFWVYENELLKRVSDMGYVPTTRIGAKPDGGDGSFYQSVNLLSPYRKNAFSADGESKIFDLDGVNLDEEMPEVKVEGEEVTNFSYDAVSGKVTFDEAPPKAANGSDNVEIKFKDTVYGYKERINKCRICCVFDNRVFLSGNDDYPGMVFHSELDNACYFADERYYDGASDDVPMRVMLPERDKLICIKEDSAYGTKVFWHTPVLDYEMGKVYPISSTNIALGAVGEGVIFSDDTVYLSKLGLEALSIDEHRGKIYHRSGFVDPKMINEENYENANMAVWNNYLMILIGSKIYLADSKQKTYKDESFEYEWYVWDNIGIYDESGDFYEGCCLKNTGKMLIFGCSNGEMCIFGGSNDNGRAILAHWCTPEDIFRSLSYVKTVNKRGAVAIVKRIQNGRLKIAIRTNKESFKKIHESVTEGFSFAGVNFGEFNFGTGLRGNICFKIKRNNIWYMQLKFYSDEADKPFGLYEVALEYNLSKYYK